MHKKLKQITHTPLKKSMLSSTTKAISTETENGKKRGKNARSNKGK